MDEEGAGLLYIYVSDRGEGTRQQQQQLGTTDSEIKLVELLKSTSSDDYWQLAVPVSVTQQQPDRICPDTISIHTHNVDGIYERLGSLLRQRI